MVDPIVYQLSVQIKLLKYHDHPTFLDASHVDQNIPRKGQQSGQHIMCIFFLTA